MTFMMLDQDIMAVSPSSVWRVLGQAGLLAKWNLNISGRHADNCGKRNQSPERSRQKPLGT